MIPCPRRGVVALLLAATLALPAAAQARFAPTALIVEGHSIAGVHIGDTRAQAEHAWGKPTDRCRSIPVYDGTVCEFLEHLTVTFDGTRHVTAINANYRVNVTQRHPITGNRRRGIFATRAGIGPVVAQNTMLHHYGKRAAPLPRRTDPGFGGVDRTWVVRGPAGRVTLFGVVGANRGPNGGQITNMTVARELTPVITGPARLGVGSVAPVVADGLVPGLPYRVEVLFGGADPVPLAPMRADAQGHAQASVAYDGALAVELATRSAAVTGDLAGTLRVVAMDGDEVPAAGAGRPFWLGPVVAGVPIAIAAPAVTMTVEPAGPVSFDSPLTVRFGGLPPTTLQGDQSPGLSYDLEFQAPCGDQDIHVFQDPVAGVLSLPGAADRSSPQRSVSFACGNLPPGQPATVSLVLFRSIQPAKGPEKTVVAAQAAITFLRP